MHQPLAEVGGGGSLEAFPHTGPASPCMSALSGQDDPPLQAIGPLCLPAL